MPDKTIVVTGASRGIGKVTAELCAQQGYTVFGTSRHPVADIENGVHLVMLDVCDAASVQACVDLIMAQTGRIDILVNNAGAFFFGAAEETSIDEAKALFEINVFGVMRMVSAVLPVMRQQQSGLIINISSLAGLIGVPFNSAYCASKFALEGYSEVLRYEVKSLGIDVTLVEPSDIHTDVAFVEPQQQLTVYADHRERAKKIQMDNVHTGPEPDVVARKILSLIQGHPPQMRYEVGKDRHVPYFRRLLPYRLGESILRKLYGLDE